MGLCREKRGQGRGQAVPWRAHSSDPAEGWLRVGQDVGLASGASLSEGGDLIWDSQLEVEIWEGLEQLPQGRELPRPSICSDDHLHGVVVTSTACRQARAQG